MFIEKLFSLKDKVAFISGASGGLGLHMASVLAQAGAAVALAARRAEQVEKAAAELVAKGHRACGVYLDVTVADTIKAAFDKTEQLLGAPVDVLVNSAGVLYAKKFIDQEESEVSRVFDTNLKGTFLVGQEAARRMLKCGRGSIINVASTAGLRSGGYISSYGTSKAGLIHLTNMMALELSGKGVRVNTLCPGNFETDMQKVFEEQGFTETLLRRTPQRRFGAPEDLDGALLLLASDAGRYMTGAIVTVDGGQSVSWM